MVLAAMHAACGDNLVPAERALFSADYATTYTEVRNCRYSIEHGLIRVRVLASPQAVAAYTTRAEPFPVDSVLLKEEYGESDDTCSGEIEGFTVMQKLEAGSSMGTLDWQWQRADFDATPTSTSVKGCIHCHTDCGVAPDGYDGTCTVP